jgi:hypothetical protein
MRVLDVVNASAPVKGRLKLILEHAELGMMGEVHVQ